MCPLVCASFLLGVCPLSLSDWFILGGFLAMPVVVLGAAET